MLFIKGSAIAQIVYTDLTLLYCSNLPQYISSFSASSPSFCCYNAGMKKTLSTNCVLPNISSLVFEQHYIVIRKIYYIAQTWRIDKPRGKASEPIFVCRLSNGTAALWAPEEPVRIVISTEALVIFQRMIKLIMTTQQHGCDELYLCCIVHNIHMRDVRIDLILVLWKSCCLIWYVALAALRTLSCYFIYVSIL